MGDLREELAVEIDRAFFLEGVEGVADACLAVLQAAGGIPGGVTPGLGRRDYALYICNAEKV